MNMLPPGKLSQVNFNIIHNIRNAISPGPYANGGWVVPPFNVPPYNHWAEEPLSVEPVEHIQQEMYGYRSWNTFDGGLYSLVHSTETPLSPGKAKAVCKATAVAFDHSAPADNCHCGYFAYWTMGPNGKEYPSLSALNHNYYVHGQALWANMIMPTSLAVSGVVRASGHVVMHEFGFRAEFMEILALSPLPHESLMECEDCAPFAWLMPDLLHELSERYTVPTFDTFADLYREYPPTNENEKNQGRSRGGWV